MSFCDFRCIAANNGVKIIFTAGNDLPSNQLKFAKVIEEAIIFKICNAYCKSSADREDLAQEIIYQYFR